MYLWVRHGTGAKRLIGLGIKAQYFFGTDRNCFNKIWNHTLVVINWCLKASKRIFHILTGWQQGRICHARGNTLFYCVRQSALWQSSKTTATVGSSAHTHTHTHSLWDVSNMDLFTFLSHSHTITILSMLRAVHLPAARFAVHIRSYLHISAHKSFNRHMQQQSKRDAQMNSGSPSVAFSG